MPNPSTAMLSAETWAEVRSHDHVMRYRRSGVGPSVVLLQSMESPEPLWPELIEALGARFRVIAPEMPPPDADIGSWLTDFLEGLGLSGVTVVAADGFCIPALELALLGSDQFTRVVLVPGGHVEETGLTGTLVTSMHDVSVALLIVRRELPADDALPLLMRFLTGTGASVPG